jgi:hypothetical protein
MGAGVAVPAATVVRGTTAAAVTAAAQSALDATSTQRLILAQRIDTGTR